MVVVVCLLCVIHHYPLLVLFGGVSAPGSQSVLFVYLLCVSISSNDRSNALVVLVCLIVMGVFCMPMLFMISLVRLFCS